MAPTMSTDAAAVATASADTPEPDLDGSGDVAEGCTSKLRSSQHAPGSRPDARSRATQPAASARTVVQRAFPSGGVEPTTG